MQDRLDVSENLVNTNPGGLVAVGTRILVDDSFKTENWFNGAEFGLNISSNTGPWTFEFVPKFGLGFNYNRVTINGTTQDIAPNGAVTNLVGGLLAQSTNIGTESRADFSFLLDLGLNTRYALTDRIALIGGYDFLLLTKVLRAGDQIDLTVNSTGIPPGTRVGAAQPAFVPNYSEVWAQGFRLGVEFSF